MRTASRKNTAKIFASVVLVGAAASVAGLGTFGSFTSSTSASEDVATGHVQLTSAAGVQALSVKAENLVPGDTVERDIVLNRSSDTERFGSVTLTTAGTTANLLTTDGTNGLQLKVDECSVPWTKVGTTKTLTCSGTSKVVIPQQKVIGAGMDLGTATAALNGETAAANLRVTLSLPTSADNQFQGLTNTIGFTFDATQRAAEAR